jgi:prepilin-type N-terminal cleavage/methylation domain-containing protein
MKKLNQKGFTLIELLVVIAIIAILAVIVFVALNPVKRFQDSRNARRTQDAQSMLTAIHESIVDNGGTMPVGITTSEQQLGTCTTGGNTLCTTAAAACVDLSTTLASYMKSIPVDPGSGTAATTGYSVVRDANNIVTIKACGAEAGAVIQASR